MEVGENVYRQKNVTCLLEQKGQRKGFQKSTQTGQREIWKRQHHKMYQKSDILRGNKLCQMSPKDQGDEILEDTI